MGVRGLHTLARLHGVQTAYHDNDGHRVTAGPEALMAVLRALGVPVRTGGDVPGLVALARRERWETPLEPVVVAWGDGSDGVCRGETVVRLPARLADAPLRVTVSPEDGAAPVSTRPAGPVVDRAEADGAAYVARRVPLPAVSPGYHDLSVEVGGGRGRRYGARLIAAPLRGPDWPSRWDGDGDGGGWGLFAPLYALWEGDDPKAARLPDFSLLARLAERTAERGGAVVGTLPLLAAFLDRPFEPSPYAPVSRLFWNELYVRPAAEAADPLEHGSSGPFDPRRAMAAKRSALEREAAEAFDERGAGPAELEAFRRAAPRVDDYARFRALVERHGSFEAWPDRIRARDVRPGDYDEAVARYHLYAQWRADAQLAAARDRSERAGVGLYLDLPLGVHPWGYDVWRERPLFASGASAGAPPDALAAGGQDWGFPPLRPEASRREGHRYFIDSIRSHLRFARVLRIDHVMQLHRMYWVPGGDARSGVYVRYPAEELHAILALESRRAGAVIVGEDLGTVPKAVRRGMSRHGLRRMYVLEFELEDVEGPDGAAALLPRRVPPGALASLGTHDTPSFAGWWWGRDIGIRRELGQLTDEEAEEERRGRGIMREKLRAGLGVPAARASDPPLPAAPWEDPSLREEALRVEAALLRRLGRSAAGLVLATLEDLWLEPEPQNVPGTAGDRNWRRRAARSLDALEAPAVAGILDVLNQSRKETE